MSNSGAKNKYMREYYAKHKRQFAERHCKYYLKHRKEYNEYTAACRKERSNNRIVS